MGLAHQADVQFTPTFFWDDVGPLDPPMGFDSSCAGEWVKSTLHAVHLDVVAILITCIYYTH
jgi:hypothetical protein